MIVQNRWNGRKYEVVEETENAVRLKRLQDYMNKKAGTIFLISKSDFTFNYFLKN